MAAWWTAVAAVGESINWFSPALRTNLVSNVQAMDGAFGFQLGVFTGGFGQPAGHHQASAQAAHPQESGLPAGEADFIRVTEMQPELTGR